VQVHARRERFRWHGISASHRCATVKKLRVRSVSESWPWLCCVLIYGKLGRKSNRILAITEKFRGISQHATASLKILELFHVFYVFAHISIPF